MRLAHLVTRTCALAILLTTGAATVTWADAAPSASATELKSALAAAPSTGALANGDPGGAITGTINDVPVADPKTGITIGDVANQVGQNKIAVNFVWTLVTGFLVMFMQAGFAMVEAGLCRVKNANHTYMMNFFVYTCGLFAYWIIGFAIQMGGAAGNGNLGGLQSLNTEHMLTLFGTHWGIFGECGMFLAGSTYDVGVMVIFLFEMVFMDTALTIVTGACAERWKFLGLRGFLGADGRLYLSSLRQLGLGRRLALAVRRQPRTRKRLLRLCRIGCRACGWWHNSAGGGDDHRSAHRQVQSRRLRPTPSSATTSRRCSSAASFWPSVGSDSIPAAPSALRRPATCASVRSPSTPCLRDVPQPLAQCSICGSSRVSPTPR